MSETTTIERLDFATVVDRHKGIIYKVARSYCRNDDDRKDLIQEIILQLWRSFTTYDGRVSLSTWMYRIALNVAISNYRKVIRRTPLTNPLPEGLIESIPNPESERPHEELRKLEDFIQELNELDRGMILLYLDERGHKEIAEIFGISVTNVSTRIGRIKEKLKQKFEENKNT